VKAGDYRELVHLESLAAFPHEHEFSISADQKSIDISAFRPGTTYLFWGTSQFIILPWEEFIFRAEQYAEEQQHGCTPK
jgi:hypothetical protein